MYSTGHENLRSPSRIVQSPHAPARLAILDVLREGEACVCHLEAALGFRQAYISQQLMVLREAGLVQDRREGLNVFYQVTEPRVRAVMEAASISLRPGLPLAPRLEAKLDHCPCPHGQTAIEGYDLEIFTPPCEPGAERFSAVARLTTDISEVLPYLNATLRGAVYHHAAKALTWKKGGHNIAFHAYQIATSNVEDQEAARKEIEGLIALVNRTWERRAEIAPDHETHQRPTPMAGVSPFM
jgi:ArsR family transcriptional regulator